MTSFENPVPTFMTGGPSAMIQSVTRQRPTATIETLTSIWKRVLNLPQISVDYNFFDLGGDPSAAIKLFTEIAKRCGRELPPFTIYHAPTIRAMTALLEQPTTPRFSPLVMLKAGSKEPPVFIAHGLGGSVLELFQLIANIESRHPMYGLESRGSDGVSGQFTRVEDMAQFYIDAIRDLQPRGPYLLIGYSFGGLVALEIAQRLSETGEKVALLAMLDTYPHVRYLPLRQRVRLALQRTKFRALSLMQLPRRAAFPNIVERLSRTLHISRDRTGAPVPALIGESLTPPTQRLRDTDYRAWTSYRPRFYRGKIKFVRAQKCTEFPDDPTEVWADLAAEFEVETVPGDHRGILSMHSEDLAAVLSGYLREASR